MEKNRMTEFVLTGILYDLTNKASLKLTFPVDDMNAILRRLQVKDGEEIMLADPELEVIATKNGKTEKKTYRPVLFDKDNSILTHTKADFLASQGLEMIQNLGKLLKEDGDNYQDLLDLYSKLSSSAKLNVSLPATIIPYNDDSDLDFMFRGQAPHEVLRNQGDINFTDDYLTRDEDTFQVDTLTEQMLDYDLNKESGNIVNYHGLKSVACR